MELKVKVEEYDNKLDKLIADVKGDDEAGNVIYIMLPDGDALDDVVAMKADYLYELLVPNESARSALKAVNRGGH